MVFNCLKTELCVFRTLFRSFGLLGIICRVLGQFPVNASLAGDTLILKYSFFSITTFYNIFMSALPCLVYMYKRFSYKPMTQFYDWYSVSFRCIQVLVQLCTVRRWPDVFGLMGEMETFDSMLHRLPVLVNRKKTAKSNNLVWLTVPLLQILTIMYIEVKFGWKNHLYYSIRPLCTVPLLLQTVLFFFLLAGLINRTQNLQKSWILYIKLAVRHSYSRQALRLDLYRSLHNKLNLCYSLINAAFAFTLFSSVSLLFFDLITEPYHAYKSGHFTHRFSERLWCFVLVVFIAVFTGKLELANHIVLDDIFEIRISGSSQNTRSQLDLLVYHLDRNKVKVEVPGLVVFSRDFIGSFVIVLVTYFILAAQIAAQFLDDKQHMP